MAKLVTARVLVNDEKDKIVAEGLSEILSSNENADAGLIRDFSVTETPYLLSDTYQDGDLNRQPNQNAQLDVNVFVSHIAQVRVTTVFLDAAVQSEVAMATGNEYALLDMEQVFDQLDDDRSEPLVALMYHLQSLGYHGGMVLLHK